MVENLKRKSIKKIDISAIIGILISSLLFILVFRLIYFNPEPRMLREGAKELVSIINSESFFLLHPERIIFVVSQIFPVIGLKLNAPLETVFFLFNFNMFFISIVIYGVCILFKDYYAGIYLCAFQIIGTDYIFWTYPFLEQIYALLYSYLIFTLLRSYCRNQNKALLIFIIILAALVMTIHPVAFIFLSVIALQLELSRYKCK